MHVDPSRRWKIISAVLAVVAVYGLRQRDVAEPAHAAGAPARSGRIERPLRVSTASAGVSLRDLVRRMMAARSGVEVRALARKLGAVGDDDAIDAVLPLLDDPRDGVPEAVLHAFAAIGSDHAIEILIARAQDTDWYPREAAISSLGETRHRRAEEVLVHLAMQLGDDEHKTAIAALGALGTEGALTALERIGHSTDAETARAAIEALGAFESPGARAALLRLMDAPVPTIVVAALGQLDTIDDAMFAKLETMVSASDQRLAIAALSALGYAGARAVPLLVEAAFQGARDTRIAAIHALNVTASDDAISALSTLLADGDSEVATAAGVALAGFDSRAAREALIDKALAEENGSSIALDHLLSITGPEVEQALAAIVRAGGDDRDRAWTRLISLGNKDAIDQALGQLHTGSKEERASALELFASVSTPQATDALLAVVRDHGAPGRARALELLADSRATDPAVETELRGALEEGNPELASVAIDGLSKLGTDQARDALLGALDGDPELAQRAVRALDNYRLPTAAGPTMLALAQREPDLASRIAGQLLVTGLPEGIQLAERMLRDEDNSGYAVDALASAHSPEALALLERTANTPGHPARARALLSMGDLHDERTFETTRDALRDHDATVREAAASSLARAETAEARDALLDMTRAGDPATRATAVEYLRTYRDEHTSGRMRDLLRDADPSVALAAIDGLRSNGGIQDASSTLSSLVRDVNAPLNVRQRAGQVLRMYSLVDDATSQLIDALDAGAPHGSIDPDRD